MSVLKANCPSCAAPIEFKSGASIVLICPFCRSAIARTDKDLKDLGKVADIAESESPLEIGLTGEFRRERFELTGRAQLAHELGGSWDEWYATFSNGSTGWLAEAQGKFYLTFRKDLPENIALPAFENLRVGEKLSQISSVKSFVVAEKGTATATAADGEIPYQFAPNERTNYADLSGVDNAFATIDYGSNPPLVYSGEQVSLDDLGISADAKPATRAARSVSAGAMNCPHCAGSLQLVAPDKTERVTCPFCNSLLDVDAGNLQFLRALEKSPADNFVLPIGAEGALEGDVKMKIIGAVARSVTIEDAKYFWHEYLLYNARVGFRWLTHSDNHWNFVEPANVADVSTTRNLAAYKDKTFKIFQDAAARVEYVKGEFYWRVEQGETVRAVDYVAPPLMLSCEATANEMNWSLGTYKTVAEIERAFAVENLPKPYNVAPNQPFTGGFYIKYGSAMLALLCAIAIFMIPVGGATSTVLSQKIELPAAVDKSAAQTVFSQPFELKGNRNVKISAQAYFINSYVDIDVDLINEQNNEIESVSVPINYYQGVEDGESWTEGAPVSDATISSLPAGKYTLRVEGATGDSLGVLPVVVKVEQNVARGVNFWLSFFLLALLPAFGIVRWFMFETKRWNESSFNNG